MATNKEMRTEIATLAAERDVALPDDLERLNTAKLAELLADLKTAPSEVSSPVVETPLRPLVAVAPEEGDSSSAVAADLAPQPVTTSADPQPGPPGPPEASVPTPPPAKEATGAQGYYVAEGKVFKGRREPLGAFQPVSAADVAGGEEELESLREQGYLFKR